MHELLKGYYAAKPEAVVELAGEARAAELTNPLLRVIVFETYPSPFGPSVTCGLANASFLTREWNEVFLDGLKKVVNSVELASDFLKDLSPVLPACRRHFGKCLGHYAEKPMPAARRSIDGATMLAEGENVIVQARAGQLKLPGRTFYEHVYRRVFLYQRRDAGPYGTYRIDHAWQQLNEVAGTAGDRFYLRVVGDESQKRCYLQKLNAYSMEPPIDLQRLRDDPSCVELTYKAAEVFAKEMVEPMENQSAVAAIHARLNELDQFLAAWGV